ncbi:MAG: DUF393 domain-containing protein [Bryobacteraceae bacterium]
MQALVIYDGDCGICTRSKNVAVQLDFLHTMRWIPLQSAEAGEQGIAPEDLERALYLVHGGHQAAGFAAFKRIFARLPLFWLLVALAVWITPWSALAVVLLFSPLSNPVGNRVYEWVARNRYRLAGSTCKRRF